MGKLRLMSHNVWKCDKNQPDWEAIGMDCSASVRARGMVRLYGEIAPDIIGFQELSFLMADEIIRGLADHGLRYALLWGRDTPILFRQDRFELLDSDFSLYPTALPGFEGSFNNGGTKSFCVGVFRDKTGGKKLIFLTTHLWYKSGDPASNGYQAGSDEARVYQLNMAMDRLERLQAEHLCPAIIVGDLNAPYAQQVIQSALQRGYVHAHNVATEFADDEWGIHSCSPKGFKPYVSATFEKAIDHILVKDAPEDFVRRFERYTPDYYLPLSDHSPVFVDVLL